MKELQSFLGFANFYRRFVKDYVRKTRAMTDLFVTKNRIPLSSGDKEPHEEITMDDAWGNLGVTRTSDKKFV